MRPARSEPQAKESHVDVLVLIDKLDDLVLNARGVPMSNQVRLDRDEIEDIISHMRSTIPEEIKQARWIVKERQEMLAEAKREAERLITEAREHAAREASQQEVVKLAERQAEDIIIDARRKAREMRLGADDYADSILENMETNLTKFLAAVQRGREQLAARSEDHTGPPTAGFDMSHQTG
jgi:F0F1-type ATP synthase membrane subunit b/b'